MTSPAFEAFLARLYVDSTLRARFLADPPAAAAAAGLSATEAAALEGMDVTGLELAAESFASKRDHGRPARERLGRARISRLLGRGLVRR